MSNFTYKELVENIKEISLVDDILEDIEIPLDEQVTYTYYPYQYEPYMYGEDKVITFKKNNCEDVLNNIDTDGQIDSDEIQEHDKTCEECLKYSREFLIIYETSEHGVWGDVRFVCKDCEHKYKDCESCNRVKCVNKDNGFNYEGTWEKCDKSFCGAGYDVLCGGCGCCSHGEHTTCVVCKKGTICGSCEHKITRTTAEGRYLSQHYDVDYESDDDFPHYEWVCKGCIKKIKK